MGKKLLAVLMGVALTFSTAGCGGSSEKKEETKGETSSGESSEDPIKIAVFCNMSGSGADTGIMNKNGAELAVKNINEAGGIKALGGRKLELVICDTMSDTSQTKAVCERAMADESIVAGVGSGGSAYTIAMMPVFEKKQKPFVQIGVSDTITTQGYTYTFRPVPSGTAFGSTQVDFLKYLVDNYGMDIKKVGIIYENTEYGMSTAQSNVTTAEAGGFEVVYNEAFTTPASDLSSLVTALKNSGAEAIFPVCFSQDAKLLFNTMKTMDYNPVIVGGGAGFLFPAFAEELGDAVNGVVSVASNAWDTKSMSENEALKNIAQEYEETYGSFMSEHGVGFYNDIYIIAEALEACGSTDGEALKDAILGLDIPTLQPSGNLKFDETGNNENATAVMIQWQKCDDGQYRPRTVFPESEATAEYQVTK